MYVTGRKGEVWQLDESLVKVAERLVRKYPDELGHIDLQGVLFLRLQGKKVDYLGKCHYVKPPANIVALYVMKKIIDKVGVNVVKGLVEETLEVKYIIELSDDNISQVGQNIEMVEAAVLYHELLHINKDMNGIEDHDIKDFKMALNRFGVNYADGVIREESGLSGVLEGSN